MAARSDRAVGHTEAVVQLADTDRRVVAYALRHPRGRYTVERASQLSGVPTSTVYDWRRNAILVPDYVNARPAVWSYRDLVLLRVMAWLRQGGMPRPLAAEKARSIRSQLSAGKKIRRIHASRTDVILTGPDESTVEDDRNNLLPSSDFYELLSTFDLHEPIDELRSRSRGSMWAPNLITPSDHSMISPFVLAGDPCIEHSRIPTASIFALRTERRLPVSAIVDLYPGISHASVEDVVELEGRLRGAHLSRAA